MKEKNYHTKAIAIGIIVLLVGCNVVPSIIGISEKSSSDSETKRDVINVPGDYPTIQEAINAAVNGDEVVIADGSYTGPGNKNLNFHGKAITVRSENGSDHCVINLENDGRGFYFNSGETRTSIVDGLVIFNGNVNMDEGEDDFFGGGIYCYQSSPTIRNCKITYNEAFFPEGAHGELGVGGGIYSNGGSPLIDNCIIKNNWAGSVGGGIYCRGGNPIIKNCIISNNDAQWGGGVFISHGNQMIRNCVISNNVAFHGWYDSAGGGGICCSDSIVAINGCTISNNYALVGPYGETADGGGIYCYESSVSFYNGILWANTPQQIYPGATVAYSDIQGGWTGVGNIDEDPLFVGDGYHLGIDSPCIDTGNPNFQPQPDETDIDDGPRVLDGNDDGIIRVDMGADEVIFESHDVAIAEIDISEIAFLYEETTVNALIKNIGLNNETDIVVQLLINGSIVDEAIIDELGILECVDVDLSWIPYATGIFNISIYAVPVLGENHTYDNSKSCFVSVISAPNIWVDPEALNIITTQGNIEQRNITIGNNGTNTLQFNIDSSFCNDFSTDPELQGENFNEDARVDYDPINERINWIGRREAARIDRYFNLPETYYDQPYFGCDFWATSIIIDDQRFGLANSFRLKANNGKYIGFQHTMDADLVGYGNSGIRGQFYNGIDTFSTDWILVDDEVSYQIDIYFTDNTANIAVGSTTSDVIVTGDFSGIYDSFHFEVGSHINGVNGAQGWFDNLNILSAASWLNTTPSNGSIAVSDQMNITVAVDTTMLDPGDYISYVVIFSNDPDENPKVIPVNIHITEESENPPYQPTNPNPEDGATNVSIHADLSWDSGDPDPEDTVVYYIYFEAENPDPELYDTTPAYPATQTHITYDLPELEYTTQYYWKIIAEDNIGLQTEGSLWEFTTKDSIPDLECDGSLSWINITPGHTVSGEFTVENIGESTSELDWEIESYPDWGYFSFTPDSGDDLIPEDGAVTVEVEVVAPDESETEFSGEVKIVNSENPDDFCTIDVSLATPVSQDVDMYSLFQRIFDRFPNAFPVLRNMLRLWQSVKTSMLI